MPGPGNAAADGQTSLTASLAAFVAGVPALPVPEDVAQTVRDGFVDCVAVLLAGRGEPVVDVARRYAGAHCAPGDGASLLFGPQRAGANGAALVNATCAHALDFDDVGLQGHPSAVLVPALWAEGERRGAAGADLVRAYLAGYEVWGELIGREAGRHHVKGWHPTAVFGVVAAAAGVAALRGLEPQLCRHALGLAASLASGLVANFGAMAKPWQAGLAAMRGIEAVDWAQAGMQAAPDVLEHHAGYLRAISPAGKVDTAAPISDLRGFPHLRRYGLSFKKYPVCFAAHRIVDAALDLRAAHRFAPADVRRVEAAVGTAQAAMLRNHRPRSGLEAKFSLEFGVASAFVAGEVGLAQLTDAAVMDGRVQALLPSVEIVTRDTASADEPSLAHSDRLRVWLRDGRVLDSGEVTHARGCAQAPLRPEDRQAKWHACTRPVSDIDTQALYAALSRIDAIPDVAGIVPGCAQR